MDNTGSMYNRCLLWMTKLLCMDLDRLLGQVVPMSLGFW
jgi:hypothetical protein